MVEIAYIAYFTLSLAVTAWAARTLSHTGLVFLTGYFGQAEMARSANRLLVAGFCFINIGFITLTLSLGEAPRTTVEAIRFVSTKTGLAVLVIGATHYFNMVAVARYGRKMSSWLGEERAA